MQLGRPEKINLSMSFNLHNGLLSILDKNINRGPKDAFFSPKFTSGILSKDSFQHWVNRKRKKKRVPQFETQLACSSEKTKHKSNQIRSREFRNVSNPITTTKSSNSDQNLVTATEFLQK